MAVDRDERHGVRPRLERRKEDAGVDAGVVDGGHRLFEHLTRPERDAHHGDLWCHDPADVRPALHQVPTIAERPEAAGLGQRAAGRPLDEVAFHRIEADIPARPIDAERPRRPGRLAARRLEDHTVGRRFERAVDGRRRHRQAASCQGDDGGNRRQAPCCPQGITPTRSWPAASS
jgi:hypothetical protein